MAVTNKIPNSTITAQYWDGEIWQIKVAANSGYIFDGAPKIAYDDTMGDYNKVSMTLNNARNLASYYPDENVDADTDFTITGSTKADELKITNNVANTTVESTKSGSYSGSITLKANDGYKIDTASVSYTDGYGDPVTDNMQISADGKSATWSSTDFEADYDVYINGTTSESTVTPTFTNNVPNTEISYSGSNHQYVVTITAKDGYLIDGTPEASYTGYSSDEPVSVSFAVASDLKSASGVCPDVDENTPVVITGNTKEEVIITVTNNITGTTETHTFDGTNFSVTVTGGTGRKRYKNPTVSYTDTDGNTQTVEMSVSQVENVAVATAQVTGVKNNTTVTLNGSYTPATFIKQNLSNCTIVETLPDYIFGGDVVSVTVNANPNTVFETIPVFTWDDSTGDYQTQEMTLSTDKKTATGTFTNPTDTPQELNINATATPEKVIGGNYGAINVYKVTLDNLEAFSEKRFFKETETDGTVTLINLGEYVNRIKRLFFTVPTASTDVIKCGNYNTGVECEAPDTDTVTLNFGTITVPTPNGDATDYQSELKLFLPFHGYETLPVDYVGKNVSVVYTVNVITGGGVAKVMCGDDVVMLVDVEPNEDILYRTTTEQNSTIGGDTWNEEYLYGVEPFLYVKYYDSLNKDARNNDYENAKLGDLSGFCVVDGVTLSPTAEMTADEQETILTLLKQGVYIE